MSMSPFEVAGALLANGLGILFLAALAGSIVLIWDWRWAVVSSTLLLLGVSSIAVRVHGAPTLIAAVQWLAIVVATLLLGLAAHFHPRAVATLPNANWLLRTLALGFLLGAWWMLDSGFNLPLFSRVETDLLIWVALCGVLLLGLSASPFYTGIGLLLVLAPLQSIASVLMPGAGLSIFVGIGQILAALACAYLTLAQPSPVIEQRKIIAPLARYTPMSTPAMSAPVAPPLATQSVPKRLVWRRALFAAKDRPVSVAPPVPQSETQTSIEEHP